jgi:hypothetical protein
MDLELSHTPGLCTRNLSSNGQYTVETDLVLNRLKHGPYLQERVQGLRYKHQSVNEFWENKLCLFWKQTLPINTRL